MCDVPFDAAQSSIAGHCQLLPENAMRPMIRRAFVNWQKARVHKRLRQQLDNRTLADIGPSRFPTMMDRVSGVAVDLLGAPTFKENYQC